MVLDTFAKKLSYLGKLGARSPHAEKMIGLDNDSFRKAYLKLMDGYGDYWENGKTPRCSKCHTDINGPEDLRKYAGQVLHQRCFEEEWRENREDEQDPSMREYLDRVASLMGD